MFKVQAEENARL